MSYCTRLSSSCQTLPQYLPLSDFTAANVLALLLTVDGSGSGLDADLLDGLNSTAFALASHVHAGEDITSGTVADARIAAILTGKTLTTPTIASFANAGHDHSNAAGGGTLAGYAVSGHTHAYQPLDDELTAIAGLTSAADKVPYFTGLGAAAAADSTAFGRARWNDADAAALRTAAVLGTIATEAETNYALLAGRAGGQSLRGGNAANDDLTLEGTSHATKTTSYVLLQPSGGNVAVGLVAPISLLHIRGTSAADGSAPVTLTVDDTLSSSGWTVGAPYAQISFASQDTSGAGAGTKAKIAGVMEVANGGSAGLAFFTTNSTAGLVEKMRLSAAGNLSLPLGNLGIGVATAADNLEINKTDPKIRFTDNDAATFSDFNGGFDFYAMAARVGFLTYSLGSLKLGTSDTGASVDIRTGNNIVRLSIGNTGDFAFNTNQVFLQQSTGALQLGGTSPTAFLHLPASTSARASQRIPEGAAVTAPNSGDLWFPTGGRLNFRRASTTEIIPTAPTQAAFTQTYSTADRTIGAYTADNESGAYTGIDNAQVGTVYAQLADLQALRVAYENLRVFTEDIAQALNAVIDDAQLFGIAS